MRNRNGSRKLRSVPTGDPGITLVEILMALGLTVMISTVVSSAMFQTATGIRSFRRLTDQYESIRLASAMITQDVRFASMVTCDPSFHLVTLTNRSGTDYLKYEIKLRSGTTTYDLHRNDLQVGRSEIVAYDIKPPVRVPKSGKLVPSKDRRGSYLACEASVEGFTRVEVNLVKPPLPGQTEGISLFIYAFQR